MITLNINYTKFEKGDIFMEIKLVKVLGKEPKESKEGKSYYPSYLALQLENGKLIFVKPYDKNDYAILNAFAVKR